MMSTATRITAAPCPARQTAWHPAATRTRTIRSAVLTGPAVRGLDRAAGRTSAGTRRTGPQVPAGTETHLVVAAAGPRRAGDCGRVVRLGRDRADDRVWRDPPAARYLELPARRHRRHFAGRGRGLRRVRPARLADQQSRRQRPDAEIRPLVGYRRTGPWHGRTGRLSPARPGRDDKGAVGGHHAGVLPASPGTGARIRTRTHAPQRRFGGRRRCSRGHTASAAQPALEATGQYPPDQTGNSQTHPIEDVIPTPPSAVPAAPWTQPCNAAGQRRADRNRAVYLARQAQARPPARMRLPDAYTAAASVIASGQRVSRRSLRSAGLHGSNADLGMLARLVRGNPYGDESRAAP